MRVFKPAPRPDEADCKVYVSTHGTPLSHEERKSLYSKAYWECLDCENWLVIKRFGYCRRCPACQGWMIINYDHPNAYKPSTTWYKHDDAHDDETDITSRRPTVGNVAE